MLLPNEACARRFEHSQSPESSCRQVRSPPRGEASTFPPPWELKPQGLPRLPHCWVEGYRVRSGCQGQGEPGPQLGSGRSQTSQEPWCAQERNKKSSRAGGADKGAHRAAMSLPLGCGDPEGKSNQRSCWWSPQSQGLGGQVPWGQKLQQPGLSAPETRTC